MAKIAEYLSQILSARYGKDVRQSIHDAIEEIDKVADTAKGSATEAATQAEQYRNEAEQLRNEAAAIVPESYPALVDQVSENTIKVDTIIEKVDLGIKETASGEEIHLTDSAEGKAVEFALYGKAKQNTTSGKNFLKYPYNHTTKTESGITFTDIGDGTILANGTATADVNFILKTRILGFYEFEKGSYILSGCPSGGSVSTYGIAINKTVNGVGLNLGSDYGNGTSIEILEENYPHSVFIIIKSGTKLENLVFKPMIRLASITDDTYEPYTNGASPNPDYPQEIEVSGESYNLLKNTATSQEVNGITFTVNEDKSISLSGTPSDTTVLELKSNLILPSGDYILSGCPSGGASTSNYKLDIVKNGASTHMDIGNSVTFTSDGETPLLVRIVLYNGTNVDGKVFKPMIRKASVKNDRYMPYGKGSVEVKSCRKNLAKLEQGTLAHDSTGEEVDSDIRLRTNFIPIKPLTDYIASSNKGLSIRNGVIYDINKKRIVHEYYPSPTTGILNVDNINARYIRLIYSNANNTNINPNDYQYQFELGAVVTPYVEYQEPLITTATIPTENGLAGIKVDSGGNYTDQNGQQWICDEVVKYADGSGAFVQRIKKITYDGVNVKFTNKSSTTKNIAYYASASATGVGSDAKRVSSAYEKSGLLCTRFRNDTYVNTYNMSNVAVYQSPDFSQFYFGFGLDSELTTVELVNEWLANNPFDLYYELAEPITTPLTAEEVAEISTFYPITNISNDFDCGMSVKYNADSKNYIDKKISELAVAMVSNI